ncbi:amino acid ABC transporter substrate-binding protein [Vibrio sp. vnigr-6D03]|uniref:amino acid ABC transporter substrate-binding protein n=1 Tax=Vibrio sp. vnigr-6D03 TaxID=2058088 RepID=UPI000C32657E|nr:amino acid ABC transporter substrate-binding protein [Vibrio sp. vnigr-6D03]PKF79671.1 amino acid ABC transporter substrate-binding protein [Vibrio sp. vnigr-6D03]
MVTRKVWSALAALAVFGSGFVQAGTIDDIRKKGELACGVSEGTPGFSNPDSSGRWVGLDVDICRAVAAAVLGDAEKVKFVPLASKQKIVALASGQVDMTSRTTTWTMKRDTKEGVDFTKVVYYDGQGFMVNKQLGIKHALQLNGASVCVTTGTTTELNLTDFARANSIKLEAVVFEGKKEAFNAYKSGRCDAFTTDVSQLASWRSTLPDSSKHVILNHLISKEPLAPLVRHGDNQWKDLVTWVINGLMQAEEKGITQSNVSEQAKISKDPSVQRMLGASGNMGKALSLDPEWLKRSLLAVGNYEEIFERNLGKNTPLGLERGVNSMWVNGGLMYAYPIR